MSYINHRKSFVLLALLSAMLLSACGSSPTKDASGTINPKAAAVEVSAAAAQSYQAALTAMDKKQWDRAGQLLQQMRVTYPSLTSVQVAQAWVHWQSGKAEEAVVALQALIAEKPLYKSDAYNYLAVIYREQGQFAKAENLYKDALQIWPGDALLYKNLGILYDLYLDRSKDALTLYRQAQNLGGNDKQLAGWIKDLERRTQ